MRVNQGRPLGPGDGGHARRHPRHQLELAHEWHATSRGRGSMMAEPFDRLDGVRLASVLGRREDDRSQAESPLELDDAAAPIAVAAVQRNRMIEHVEHRHRLVHGVIGPRLGS